MTPITRATALTISADFTIQICVFFFASAFQTATFYDLTGSISFIFCTYLSLVKPWITANGLLKPSFHTRQILASGTTAIWATYLGTFLFTRALAHRDRRFEKVKSVPSKFIFYWLVQGIWVAITALPVYLTNAIPSEFHPSIGLRDYIGVIIWIFGFTFQVVANYQKHQWRKNIGSNYSRSFISHGLWSLSRHPNYFGECVLWVGSYLLSATAFPHAVESQIMPVWLSRVSLLSPIFVTILITRVSGIPLLEKENDRRLKDVVAYWVYKKKTSMFVPTWPRSVE